jgi:hypothetical protein
MQSNWHTFLRLVVFVAISTCGIPSTADEPALEPIPMPAPIAEKVPATDSTASPSTPKVKAVPASAPIPQEQAAAPAAASAEDDLLLDASAEQPQDSSELYEFPHEEPSSMTDVPLEEIPPVEVAPPAQLPRQAPPSKQPVQKGSETRQPPAKVYHPPVPAPRGREVIVVPSEPSRRIMRSGSQVVIYEVQGAFPGQSGGQVVVLSQTGGFPTPPSAFPGAFPPFARMAAFPPMMAPPFPPGMMPPFPAPMGERPFRGGFRRGFGP